MKTLVLVLILGITGCKKFEHRCSIVASVGGCDKNGLCGVRLENGRIQTNYFPVVGEEACYDKVIQ